MTGQTQDFAGTPEPKPQHTRAPYTPPSQQEAAEPVVELRAAAAAERQWSKAVQDFLNEQKRRHEARLAQGVPFGKQVFPELPDEATAAEALATARKALASAIEVRKP